MWWKLGSLFVLTVVVVVAIIPIHTRAVLYNTNETLPVGVSKWTLPNLFMNMYITPATIVQIGLILLIAVIIGAGIAGRHS